MKHNTENTVIGLLMIVVFLAGAFFGFIIMIVISLHSLEQIADHVRIENFDVSINETKFAETLYPLMMAQLGETNPWRDIPNEQLEEGSYIYKSDFVEGETCVIKDIIWSSEDTEYYITNCYDRTTKKTRSTGMSCSINDTHCILPFKDVMNR